MFVSFNIKKKKVFISSEKIMSKRPLRLCCSGPKQFLGAVFQVESKNDLGNATQLPRASTITELKDDPGDGFFVNVPDREAYPVSLIFGKGPFNADKGFLQLTTNYEDGIV